VSSGHVGGGQIGYIGVVWKPNRQPVS